MGVFQVVAFAHSVGMNRSVEKNVPVVVGIL
jgi:hypothetical protein